MSRKVIDIPKSGGRADPDLEKRVDELQDEVQEIKWNTDITDQTTYAMKMFVKTNTTISNSDALKMPDMFPTFEELCADKKEVEKGIVLSYGLIPDTDKKQLWRTEQKTLPQSIYPPGEGTESLYSKIDLEHSGTQEDPIPWQKNMQCYEGKYYTENGQLYKCIRDSGIPLYYNISDLIGNYFEKVV